jgi:outer membrane protein TolC
VAVFIVSLATSAARSQTVVAETLTVDQVVREVVRNNDRLAAAAYMEEAVRREVGPAGAWDDPMLMLGVQSLPTSLQFDEDMMTMKMVGLSQKIPYAGEKGLQRKAKAAEAEAAHEDRRETALDLVTVAKTAFAELYYHKQLIDDLERQKSLYEQVLANARSRVAANQAGLDELAAAQAAVWRTEAEILSHHNDAHTAFLQLQALRGGAPSNELPIVTAPDSTPLPNDPAPWLAASQELYPPLRRLRHESDRYGFSARASQRMSWPMLELGGSYGFREDLHLEGGEIMPQDNMVNFQVSLSLPFFDGRQQKNMAKSMRAMQRRAESEASQLARDVEAALGVLHQRAGRLQQSLHLYREQIVPADEEAFRSALNGYAAGRTSLPDVLEYALGIYRDRTMASQLELAYAKTLIEAGRYITDADVFLADAGTK